MPTISGETSSASVDELFSRSRSTSPAAVIATVAVFCRDSSTVAGTTVSSLTSMVCCGASAGRPLVVRMPPATVHVPEGVTVHVHVALASSAGKVSATT